jgi:hypothetical protein
MQIFVKTWGTWPGDYISLDVEYWNTVDDVKDKIYGVTGIVPEMQRLVHDYVALEAAWTLWQCEVCNLATLHLVVGVYFQISVKPLTGNTIYLDVEATNTIDNVKGQIQNALGIPPAQQRLVARNMVLQSRMELEYYNLREGSVLYLDMPNFS